MRVIVMAGTSDAVRIIEKLHKQEDIEVIATTTTTHGRDLAISAGADEVLVGRLGVDEIVDLIEINQINLLIDATHPFAADASLNAIKSTYKAKIPYIRFERPSTKIPDHENIFEVSSFEEAALKTMELMKEKTNSKIMHLAGVSTLSQMIQKISPHSIIVRVLPMIYSIQKCLDYGIPNSNIIAMQGTFSKEFNKALMKEYEVEVVVSKESGESGGTSAKIEAAIELGIPIVIVKRPKIVELEHEIVIIDLEDFEEKIRAFRTSK
jgi:precorrin-6A/cobalt-precorrin-6A reductase